MQGSWKTKAYVLRGQTLVFRLRYRPHSSGSEAVSQMLESPSECPLGTKGHQKLYKEIQRIIESPRKCFLSITIRPCCQGIFEAASRKNEQETWIYTKPFWAAPKGGAHVAPSFNLTSCGRPHVDLIRTEMVQESMASAVPCGGMPHQRGPNERLCGGVPKTSIR